MTKQVWVRNLTLFGHPFLLFENGDFLYVGLSMQFFFSSYARYYHRSAWN